MSEGIRAKSDNYLEALVRRHRDLDAKIASLALRPGVPDTELTALKRRKLGLAERIARLRRGV